MSVFEELAARIEALDRPDREVDCLIWCAANGIMSEWQGVCLVAGKEGVIGYIDPGVHQRNFSTNRATQGPGSIPAYTASLDAAMTLVETPNSFTVGQNVHHRHWVASINYLGDDGAPHSRSDSYSPDSAALALTAAALRARAAS